MEHSINVNYDFCAPRRIVSGGGTFRKLPEMVGLLKGTNVLLVTDRYLLESGLVDEAAGLLSEAGIGCVVFHRISPDPTMDSVLEGLALLRESACDVVVALGGGSPIDAAKAISILATNDGPLARYAGYHQIPHRGIPLIAIPTTAGTGSEATRVAVITDEERQVKMMIFDNALLPDVAVVDYRLSMSMPPQLTAYVGVDTLTHGLEAYVSAKRNPLSDPMALSCIGLVGQHLLRAYDHPTDERAREGMAIAACQGGLAFSNSSVCLVHGMSRPLGAVYHLAHGLSNAILLPELTRFSLPGSITRYATAARTMGIGLQLLTDKEVGEALVSALEALNRQLNVPRLRDCVGVPLADFKQSVAKMAADALASGSPQNNPVVPTAAEIERLYLACW